MEHLAPGKEGPTRNLPTCRWLTNVSANHQVILWELIRERVALTKWETVSGRWPVATHEEPDSSISSKMV